MTTVQTAEAAQAVPSSAEAIHREWVMPEAEGFDTAMEVTAYAGRR